MDDDAAYLTLDDPVYESPVVMFSSLRVEFGRKDILTATCDLVSDKM